MPSKTTKYGFLFITGVILIPAVIAFATNPVIANVTMGELTITGDDKTLNNAPSSINIHTSGEYDVTATQPPEKVEVILQVHVGGLEQQVDDIGTHVDFDQFSGSFSITEDLYSHSDVKRGDLTPTTQGETKTTELLVRVVCRITIDGELSGESFVEDTASVVITLEGTEVSVGGSGSVSIVQ